MAQRTDIPRALLYGTVAALLAVVLFRFDVDNGYALLEMEQEHYYTVLLTALSTSPFSTP